MIVQFTDVGAQFRVIRQSDGYGNVELCHRRGKGPDKGTGKVSGGLNSRRCRCCIGDNRYPADSLWF